MLRLLLRWAISAVAVYVAIGSGIVPGLHADGGWSVYFAVALILGLANALIAPIIKGLTCPLVFLTLGLFTLVINGLMLWITALIAQQLGFGFTVANFGSAILGALIISVVSFVLSVITGANRKNRR
jgi:putative membrane protein